MWLYQGGSHGPNDQDVNASQPHRPAYLFFFVNLFPHVAISHWHCDPCVGQHMKDSFAFGHVPESGLILSNAAVEYSDGDPPEDDWHGKEDRDIGKSEGGILVAIIRWTILERQGKKCDGDNQEDMRQKLEGERGAEDDLLFEVKLSVLPDVHGTKN